jgi:hypothetical protein
MLLPNYSPNLALRSHRQASKTAAAFYNSLFTDVAIKGASGYILPVTSNNY